MDAKALENGSRARHGHSCAKGVVMKTKSVFKRILKIFRPVELTWKERDALQMAVHFLSKPLSELKQYESDNCLMGSNSMAALRSGVEKACANL